MAGFYIPYWGRCLPEDDSSHMQEVISKAFGGALLSGVGDGDAVATKEFPFFTTRVQQGRHGA